MRVPFYLTVTKSGSVKTTIQMKTTLTIIALLFFISSYSQSLDTSKIILTSSGHWSSGIFFGNSKDNKSVSIRYDGKVELQGIDSTEAIKLLFKRIEEENKKEIELYEFVNAAVDFANTVPDHFKKSKEWAAFKKQLYKQGFRIVPKK